MYMSAVRWSGGKVSTDASVELGRPLSGAQLRDAYVDSVRKLTFGLARFGGGAVRAGPLTLLRFGPPAVTGS